MSTKHPVVGEIALSIANVWHEAGEGGAHKSVLFMRVSGCGGTAEVGGVEVDVFMPMGSADLVVEIGSMSAPDGYDRRYIVRGEDIVRAVLAFDEVRRAALTKAGVP